jgi:hypothetical protein
MGLERSPLSLVSEIDEQLYRKSRGSGRESLWSSGQKFLATDPEARVRFPALPEKKVVGLERGPLSLVGTTDELLDRKVAAPV